MSVQSRRDEASGLAVSDRYFRPEDPPRAHVLRWAGMDLLLLLSVLLGLGLLCVSGFALPVSAAFFVGAVLLCVLAVILSHVKWCRRHALPLFGVFLLAALALLFVYQDAFLSGMRTCGRCAAQTLRRTYSVEEQTLTMEALAPADVFLLFVWAALTAWLSQAFLVQNSLMMAVLAVVPLMIFMALCGAMESLPALLLLLFGLLQGIAYSRVRRQRRMWGGDRETLRSQNENRFQTIQKRGALLVVTLCLALSFPCYWLVRPFFAVAFVPAEKRAAELQTVFLNQLVRVLPGISADRLNLLVQAIGGGVQEGSLQTEEGYLLEGIEDLRITMNQKPRERLFLKGFIGTDYEDGEWKGGYATTFDSAALGWRTDGPPRLYIQNLAFLRMVYAQNHPTSEFAEAVEPAQLQVERINASDKYTYVPYGAYLNDYYEIDSGDGAVKGQLAQEDRYFFFERRNLEAVLQQWQEADAEGSVLDRTEEAYRAYCRQHDTKPLAEAEPLAEQVAAAMAENRWNRDENLEEITAWIRAFLSDGYDYDLVPEAPQEGRDALSEFLFGAKKGNSVHFASAAVALYRLFGVPARYVVGYELPAELFSPLAGGAYSAVAQGDNSQAWAEIYVPGIGWTPKDMTPGVIGTLEEVGPGGEKIGFVEGEADGGEDSEASASEASGKAQDTAQEKRPFRLGQIPLERLGLGAFAASSGAVLLALLWKLGKTLCTALGLDPLRRRTGEERIAGVFRYFYRRMRAWGLPENVRSDSAEFLEFCRTQLRRRQNPMEAQLPDIMERMQVGLYGAQEITQADIARMRRLLLSVWKSGKIHEDPQTPPKTADPE